MEFLYGHADIFFRAGSGSSVVVVRESALAISARTQRPLVAFRYVFVFFCHPRRSAWCLDALFHHLDRLFKSPSAGFFFLGLTNPAGVFLAMGKTQLLEKGQQTFLLE